MTDSKDNSSKKPKTEKSIEELQKEKEHSRNGYGDRDLADEKK